MSPNPVKSFPTKKQTPQDTLLRILNNSLLMVSADRCALYLKAPGGEEFQLEASIGLSESYLDAVAKKWKTLPAAQLLQEPRFLFYPDARTDPRLLPLRSDIEAEGYRSSVIVPLPSEQAPIGVLGLYFNEIRDLSSEERATIRTFADLAAIAIENARLYQKAQEKSQGLAALNETSKNVTSSLDLDETLDSILHAAQALTGASLVDAWLRDTARNGYACRASIRSNGTSFALDVFVEKGKGLISPIIESGEVIYVKVVGNDPRWVKGSWTADVDAGSILGVPMQSKGRVFGGLCCLTKHPREWSADIVEAVEGLAAHAAIAIENAQTHEELRVRSDHQEALRKSEEKYRTLFEEARDAMYLVDEQGRLIYCNQHACDLLGYTREEMLEKRIQDITAPEYRDSVAQPIGRSIDQGMIPYASMNLKKDGTPVPIEVSAAFIEIEGRKRVIHFVRDITERRRGEEALRLTQFAVERSADPILCLAPDGRFLNVNEAACRHLGYSHEELISMTVSDINPAFPPEKWAEYWEKIKQAGSLTFESTQTTKDGREIPVEISTNYLKFAGEEYDFAFVRDITERRRGEEALRNSEARNRAILTAAPDGIITFNGKGLIDSFNPAMEEIFGTPAAEVTGRDVGTLMQPSDAKKFRAYLQWYLRTGEPHLFTLSREVAGRRKDGSTFPMNMAVSETRLEGRRIFTGIIRDLTDQKALEAQIHRAEKMETIGILASGMAHDFDNLLTTIQGNLTLALTGMRPRDPGFQHLTRVGQAVNRAFDMISRLRTLSHTLPTDKKIINLQEALQNTMDLLRVTVPASVETETRISQESCRIKADPALIQDMVLNLCLNARDAMPEGGRLIVGLERVLLEADHPDLVPEADPGEYACISVTDTGLGLNEEVRSRLFEPFFTTKGPGKGSGLGLSMVQRIVKEHGGFINLESEEGKGTTFWVYLPVTQAETGASALKAVARSARGKGERILAADDDPLVLDVVEEFLKSSGYDVIMAQDGREAVEKFRQERDRIDLVLLDVVMPRISGREAFRQIRKLRPDVKVLFASGNHVDIPEAVEESGAAFIQKPYSLSELLRSIRQILDRS